MIPDRHLEIPARQALLRAQLERVLGRPGLSRDVFEVASKSLAE